MANPEGFNLIKIGEVAKELGLPITTVRNWANTGVIPTHVRSVKGTRWFNLVDVQNALKPKALV